MVEIYLIEYDKASSARILAKVKVMPQLDSEEIEIDPQELEIYNRRSTSCRCNTCVCKTEVGVRVFHKAKGIRVTCPEERSPVPNQERAKLYIMKLAEKQQANTSIKRSQLATREDSETIRIYDFQNNCLRDLCLNQNFNLANSWEGDMETIIQSCIDRDAQERLAALANSPDFTESLN